MLKFKEVNDHIIAAGGTAEVVADSNIMAYSVAEQRVAYIVPNSQPLRVSVRCHYELSQLLVEKYESIMPGHQLDPKKWITILDTGQLSEQEILDLIDQSIVIATSVVK